MIKESESGITIDIPNYGTINELQKTVALTYIVNQLKDAIAKLNYKANTIYQKLIEDRDTINELKDKSNTIFPVLGPDTRGMLAIEVNDTIKAKLKKNSAKSIYQFPDEIVKKENEIKIAKDRAKKDKTAKKITPTSDPKIDTLFKIHLEKEVATRGEFDSSRYEEA